MVRKVSLYLVLILATLVNTPVFAQEQSTGASKVYLPLVSSRMQEQSATMDEMAEVNLTDSMDEVEAAGSNEPGVVFVTTNANDPIRGNEIVMYRRAVDGTLTVMGRFPTGGQGLGSGLGSQGALVLSKNGRWLFVVNAGSNEVSVFEVRPAGLVLTGKVASGGIRPTSLTVRNNLLYVLNAGDPGNITGFKLSSSGQLTPLANSTRNLSNNGSGPAPAPAQISFSPNGDQLIVTERSTKLIDIYTMDKKGLPTGPTPQASSGVTPFGFAFAKETLVVSEAFGGNPGASAVSSYRLNQNGLQLVSPSVPTGETAACWIVISKDGKYAYSTNAGSASVSGYRVNNDGQLTLLNGRAGDTGVGTGPTDPTISRDGRFIYVLSPRSQTIVGFQAQADGSLVSMGSFGGLQPGAAGIAAW